MDELLREFIAETSEHFALLERDLVALEQAPDDTRRVDDIFRNIHSIKGTCGFLGLKRLESLLHAAENALDKLRDGALPATAAAIGTLVGAYDRAKSIVAALAQEGREPEGGDADIVARLELAMRPYAPPIARRPPAPGLPSVVAPGPASTIRVNVETVDRLMAEISELVLARNQVMRMLRGRTDPEAEQALQRLSHVTSDLQESVMKTRMQPIGHAWAKLPRMVRDLARDLGKKIELSLEGSDTELDRQVLELVKDPFTHLLRNAADHGIETPAERRRAGKPEAGTVTISARQEGGAIVIALSDDGRGIDPEHIRAAVRRGGFASEAELAAMNEHRLLQFVFHPGFTTASRVTNVSGRGVGLDVVRSNAEKIGGTVEIASRLGRGTCFTIKIPLTLAIVPALLLECGGQRFAIPQTAVAELVRVGGEHRIERIHDARLLRLRGGLLPLVALSELLHLESSAAASGDGLIAIIGFGARRFGVIVDRVDDADEIVVKPLAPMLRGAKIFSGSTVLGDGSIALILDPGGLAAALGAPNAVDPGITVGQPKLASLSRGDGVLLFRAGSETAKALYLSSLLRIEEVGPDRIEQIDGKPVIMYRGAAVPLHLFGPLAQDGKRRVLIAVHEDRICGLVADAVMDTVDDIPALDTSLAGAGLLGVAAIGGRPVEIVDPAHYVKAAGTRMVVSKRSAA